MRTRLLLILSMAIAWSARPAGADTILFDFNSLAANKDSKNNGNDLIEEYMELVYGSDITVPAGARTRKDRVEDRPDGAYLGNSDGALDRGLCAPSGSVACHGTPMDTFLINRWNNDFDRIGITFEQQPIIAVEFDWEIFPVTQNGQTADLTVIADETQIFFHEILGANKELGDLGHFSYVFDSPVSTLQFIDWTDAPIGIDNLRVRRQETPWASPLLLLSAGLVGPAIWTLRKRLSPSSRQRA